MAPSHGFAVALHREAALRGAPASHGETAFRGAAGFREARRHAGRPLRNPAGRKRDIATVEAFIAFSIGPIQTARYLSNQTSSSRKLLMTLLTIIVQFLT
jgi:hypothetical protein